jgi:hypothetical protein
MKIILTESQYKRLFEQEERAFSKIEVAIFKNLNKNKFKLSNISAIKEYIRRALRTFGLENDTSNVIDFLKLYINNYREDGMYELTTQSELKKLPDYKAERSTNIRSSSLTRSRIPFKGSHLKGVWETDSNYIHQYVVLSYEWYPLYIFKNDQWYEVDDRYSNTTAKQMNHSRPSYNTIELSRKEMERLRIGLDIFESKSDVIFEKCNSLVGQSFRERSINGKPTIFKILSMVRDDEKVKVQVELSESDSSFRNFGDAEIMLKSLVIKKMKPLVGHEYALNDFINIEVITATQE